MVPTQYGSSYIDGWDLVKAWNDLALAKALTDASRAPNAKGCGALVDIVFDQVLKFKFAFGLGFDIDDSV